jgi:diguanylate cyclase
MTSILVVDDNATNRKLLSTLLRFEGYSVIEANDGMQGLEVARRERPHLIISDIVMPTMDGYEFVRQIRADPVLSATNVIFHTAHYHEREARSLAESCQVARVLTKPCESREVLRVVQQVLEGPLRTLPAANAPSDATGLEFGREHLRLVTNKLAEKADDLILTNERLAALTELNLQLASERDPRILLEKVCAGARDLIGARFAVLAVSNADGPHPQIVTLSGLAITPAASDFSRIQAGPLGGVVTDRQPKRFTAEADAPISLGLPGGFPDVQAFVAVPLSSLTRCYGWLCLANKLGAIGFNDEDERLLAILASQTGRIYENSSLYLEVQEQSTRLLVEMAATERAGAELQESEARFRQLAENIQDVFFLVTADLRRMLYISPAYEKIWGRRASTTQLPNWLDAVHPDDKERVRHALESVRRHPGAGRALECRIATPDAGIRWILTRVFQVPATADHAERLAGIATDITDRKQSEAKIEHLNRVHAVLSAINSLVVRVKDRHELLREACRLTVEHGRFRHVWCGWYTKSRDELVPIAAAGEFSVFEQVPAFRVGQSPPDDTLLSAALQTRLPLICNDLATTRETILNRDRLLARGFRSMAVLPLSIDGRAVGCFVLIGDEPDFFNAEEMRLLSELAGDVSYALDYIEKSERLNYLAYYDALTGLANRSLFIERLALHIGVATRMGQPLAVVVADLQRLGDVNDSLGRTAADELLRQIAQRLVGCVGQPELVARIGANQFAAIISNIGDAASIPTILDDWWSRWLASPFAVADRQITIAAKAGIAICPNDGQEAEALIRSAETALNTAKKASNHYAFYTPHLRQRLSERLSLESDLRRAVEREDFVLHYQPKVDLSTRRVTGVEALIRWRHETRGLVAPATFIPLMEESGMIIEVGAWVLRQACLDRSKWLEARLNAPRIAVNVSIIQLQRENFVRSISTLLRLAGSEAGIDIEVTESVLMSTVDDNIRKLTAVRDLGVGIALDDFGTGYSSLAYLSRLPVGTLKIDRSFVINMVDDPNAMSLISTIISLAHALEMETVAEGVETEEQAKLLRLLRCNQMQGYLISKPVPFDEITAYLGRHPV